MKIYTIACSLLGIVLTGAVISAQQTTIAGRWVVSAEGYTMPMVLEQNSSVISGTLQTPHGPALVHGDFDKPWLAFSGATEGSPHALEFVAKGIIRADGTLAGVMTSNVGDFTWTAVRAESANR